ncbi:unnamed protein product [Paramecium pentaurelia]|uniref:Transmembrane protein n=1 Tax=Paramecium pentaurelia TaxID=43138 RepID=A0A8S1TTF4_9CILI|nr:unnamed protein product [Paramecium pentaurelia]
MINLAKTLDSPYQEAHLFSVYFQEHTLIAYQTIDVDVQKIYHVIKIFSRSSDTMEEYKFEQDYLKYEGLEVGTIFSYSEELLQLQLKVNTEDQMNTVQIDNIFLQKQNVKFIFGGRNNELDLMGFQGFIFLVLNETYYTRVFYLYSFYCYESRKDFSMPYMEYLSTNLNTFNIPVKIHKEYQIQFWNKLETQINSENLIQVLVVDTQNEIDQKLSLGRNTMQVYYHFQSDSDLVIYCKYYSFKFPYNYYNVEYIQSLIQQTEITHVDPIFIYNWHFIKIQYQNEMLIFQIYFPNFNENVIVEIQNIRQFSQTVSQITINAKSDQDLEIKGQIASFIFNSCMQDFSIFQPCHFSCFTCNGPFQNNCLSCEENSNRIYNEDESTCLCKPWTLEQNNVQCYDLLQDPYVQVLYEQTSKIQGYDKIKPHIICAFGYFLYDGECIRCPSQSQNGYIICIECLLNWETWIYNSTCIKYQIIDKGWKEILQQSDYNLVDQMQNYLYTYSDGELKLCNYCFVFCIPYELNLNCYKLNVNHLGQPAYVHCLYQYDETNQVCLPRKQIDIFNYNNCGYKCLVCETKTKMCIQCINKNDILLLNRQGCQQCTIPNCKYCFQYLKADEIVISSLINQAFISTQISQSIEILNEDYLIGCALCEENFIYNFQTMKCELKQTTQDQCIDYFVNDQGNKVCLTTLTKDFTQGYELADCTDYIQKCLKCVQSNRKKLFCTQCLKGYYINNFGQCNQCNQQFTECVPDYIITNNSYITQVQPFLQAISKRLELAFNNFQYLDIYGICKGNIGYSKYCSIEIKIPYCIQYSEDSCSECQSYDNSKIITEYNGYCYKCPYQCLYCQPKSSSDDLFCLKTNFEQFSVDQFTGRPIPKLQNYLKQEQLLIYTEYNYLTLQKIDSDLIFSKVTINLYLDIEYFINLLVDIPIKNNIYSQQYISQLIINSKLYEEMVCPFKLDIFYFDEIVIKDFLISINERFCENIILITSNNGTKLTFLNITITQQLQENIYKQLFIWNEINYIEFNTVILDSIQISNFSLFYIKQNKTQNGFSVRFENVIFKNCYFFNTSVIQVDLVNPNIETNSIQFNNFTLINCTFKQSKIIQIVGEQNRLIFQYIRFSKISFLKCLIEDFQFIENYLTNYQVFTDIEILNTNFTNTNVFMIHSPVYFESIQISSTKFINSSLISTQSNSRLDSYSLKFYISQLLLNEIISDSNIIKIQHDYYEDVQISTIKITQLNQINILNQNQFLFIIQAKFVLIQDYFCSIIVQSSFQMNIINSKYIKVQNVIIYGQESISRISHEKELDYYQAPTLQNLIYIHNSTVITLLKFNITNLKIQNSNLIKLQDDSNIMEIQLIDFNIQNIILVQEFGIYETSIIQFQLSKASKVLFNNFYFAFLFGNSYEKIRKASEQLSLISFLSFQSEIQLSNFEFQNTIISNTSNALIYLESKNILLCNFTSIFTNIHADWLYQYINMIYSSSSIKVLEQLFPIQSEGSIFNIQSQYLTLINISSKFSKAIQGGFCKIELVLDSVFNIKNASISDSIAIGGKESKGGSFYVIAKDSNLILNFIDIKVITSYSLYDGGFLYLIPSNTYNRIELRNIIAYNVISLFKGFFGIQFSLQTQYNFVILSNILVNVSFDGYYQNTNEFQELNENEISYINKDNGYFYLDYCNLTIYDIYMYFDIINQPAFSLTKIENMKLYNLYMEVGELLTSSLIQYESYQNSRTKILNIAHLTLRQSIFRVPQFYKDPCLQNFKEEILQIDTQLINTFQIKQENCLITQILLQSSAPDQLISIQFSDDQQKFFIQDAMIIYFSQMSFNLGLFNIHYQKYFKSRLEQFIFINNSCISNNKLNISSQQLGGEQLVVLKKHFYYNNSNSQNGQVSISNVNYQIQQSLFIHNNALQKGGAIYIQNSPFYVISSVISENKAYQGGGIFNDIILKKDRINSLQTTLFFNNKAIYKTNSYGQEYFQLKIDTNQKINQLFNKSIQNNQTSKRGNILLHLPSGQSLQSYREFDMKSLTFSNNSINLQFKIQNYFQEDQTLTNLSILCDIQQDLLNENFKIVQTNFSFTQIQFNTVESSLNLEKLIFILNPYQNNYLQVGISCDAIENINYKFTFYVKTIKCQMGEYFQEDQCLACNSSKGYYSVNPLIGSCQKSNPYYIRNHTENLIDLYPGVWRYTLYSSTLELCSNQPKNCLGGWKFGDDTCLEGTIGALCQECDLYNTRGFGRYSKTREYTCLLCGNQGLILIEFFFVFIWVLIQIGLTVKSTQLQNQKFLYCKAQTKMYDIIVRLSQDQSGTVIKLISNYFQIVLVVYTFQLNFISNIEDVFKFVGNSTYSTTNNFDCYLSQLDIDYIYINLAFIVFIQIIQYLLYITLSFVLQKLQLNNFTQETLYSSFFYLYLSGFLNLIKVLSSLLTPKMYGEQQWISANVSHQYWTNDHQKAVYILILPLLIFSGFILPLILFITLNQNKKNFNNYSIKQKFGYLFNEYSKRFYFWELIRVSQRLLLTLIIVLLQDFIITKGILLVGLLFTYYLMFNISKPFNVGKLNKFEKECLILCIISLLLCLIQFSIQDNSAVLNYIIQVLILISLLYLVCQCAMKFISVHISKYEVFLDTIRIIIQKNIKIEYILKSKYLELSTERKNRIKRLFMKLKVQTNKKQIQPPLFTHLVSDQRFTQVSVESEKSQKTRLI